MIPLRSSYSALMLCGALAFATLLSVNVFAADVSALLDQTKKQVESKQFAEALDTVDHAIAGIWEKIPMGVRKSLLVTKKAPVFGAYDPRPNNVYEPKERVFLYLEPMGYKIKKEGEFHITKLAADFVLVDSKDNILGGKKNFGRWSFKSRAVMTKFMMNLTYTFTGLKPGEYAVHSTIRDLNSDGSITVRTPIVIQ